MTSTTRRQAPAIGYLAASQYRWLTGVGAPWHGEFDMNSYHHRYCILASGE